MNLKKTFEKLGLSHKIVSISILIVMIGITTVSAISFYFFRSTLQEIVTNQLESIGDTTANRVEEYGDKSLRFIDRLAHDRLIEGLFLSFESSFYGRGLNPGADEEIFSKDYKSIYSVYSKRLDSMLQDFGFEEIHLSTLDRQIVLSVSVDGNSKMLGKNLENGILKDSKVAKCINSAFSDESDSPHYSGYEYNPIFDEVTAYLCQKAFAEFNHLSEGINIGDTMGVVVAKLKLNHINSIVNRRIGMGETGQAYLIGPDKILRSDFYVHKDEFNVYKSFKENIPVDSETIRNVFKVDSFSQIVKDPAGEKVVSYFKKINFLGQTWGVIVEKQASEVFNAVTKILLFSFVFTAIIIVLSSFVLFYVIPRMVTPVTDAIKSLKNVSGKVNNNSYALKQSSQILDTSSNKVSQSINETMTGLDEVKATLEMNMNYVTKSMDRSKSSAEAAIRGKTYVEQTSLAMDEIETSNDDFASEIDKVNSQLTDIIQIIGEIGDKANVINDIVFQTKLLSFNASVEAAEAGEHGKGFAVVAEEVGNLAVASGNAANEIAKILSNSIQTVENIITNSKSSMQNMIDINRAKIQKGQSATKESLEVLEEVMSNAQEVYNMITEIQTASNEQFKGIDHISIQTSELIELAAEFKDLAKNSSSGSDELSNSSSALTSTVSELEDLINQKEEKSAA